MEASAGLTEPFSLSCFSFYHRKKNIMAKTQNRNAINKEFSWSILMPTVASEGG